MEGATSPGEDVFWLRTISYGVVFLPSVFRIYTENKTFDKRSSCVLYIYIQSDVMFLTVVFTPFQM